MGAAVAVALAVGIGTTGVRSNTTYKKPTQIIAAAKTTTLTDYHSNTEFTKSSDVKKIISTYGLKDSDKTSKDRIPTGHGIRWQKVYGSL